MDVSISLRGSGQCAEPRIGVGLRRNTGCVQCLASTPYFKPPTWPASSSRPPPTMSPTNGVPSVRPWSTTSQLFSIAHPLQKKDVEKDPIASHSENVSSRPESQRSVDVLDLSTKLQNPLAGRDKGTLESDAVSFCERHGFDGIRSVLIFVTLTP